MRESSSLTEDQRAAVVALFEEGHGDSAVASYLRVGHRAVQRLYMLWRVRGSDALVSRPNKKVYSFETKLDVVQRFLAGEPRVALAQEYEMPSPSVVSDWARKYRREGEDGLRPKPKGRPRKDPNAPVPELSELERLQQENEYLRVENAYLKKLKALRAQERRSR